MERVGSRQPALLLLLMMMMCLASSASASDRRQYREVKASIGSMFIYKVLFSPKRVYQVILSVNTILLLWPAVLL